MTEFFYALFIGPLRDGMGLILDWSFALTGSWGWSILLLSLAVNAALWPVYGLAEGWQEEDRALRRGMASKLAEIRAVYRGRERWLFTRALYRLHGYGPLFSLRAALGLLMQIPFFLAAYGLLHQAPELEGQGFGPLSDLARPDGLILLGGHSLHLLPLVMTGANILSASVYSSRLTRRDKIQLYLMAALFLFLLYRASSGLLLYWLCNNVFSIFKNIYYLRHVYADSRRARPFDPWRRLGRVWSLLGRMTGRVPPGLAAGCAAASIAMMILDNNLFRLRHDRFILMVPAFGLALLAACSAAGRARRERAAGGMLYLWGLFCLLLFLFLMGSLGDNRALSPVLLLHSMFYMGGIALLAFWLAALTVAGWSPHKVLDAAQADALYKNALWLILALVFFYHPSTLYASDPDFFSESAAALLGSLSALALLVLGLGRLALARCPAAARPALGAVLVWLALLMLLYSFAVRVDYGMLEGRFLSQAHKLRGALNTAADLFLLPAAWFALRPLLRGERLRGTLPGVMRGLALLLLMLSCGQMLTARRQEAAPPPQSSALPPAYTDRLFRLSGQGRNIIVLMLDMFTGEHMERLLREDPSLAQSLSGFTWYRDTLSAGNRTHRSLPGMLGGRAYDPPAVNAKADRPLEEVRNEAYAVLPNMLLEQGYDVGLAAVSYLVPHLFGRHCPRAGEVLLAQDAESAFLPWRRAASGQAMPVIRGHSAFLAVYGLFKSLPLSLRQGVYSQGRWLRSLHAASLNTESNRALFEAMLAFGSLAPDNTPVFRYIGSNLTHDPWDIDAQGRLTDPSRPHMTRDEDGIVLEHLWAEKAALRLVGTWLDTLKKAGVYDRCQIILISDHGFADAPGLLGLDNLGPLGGADNMRGSALLLLKNFDAQGPLRTDHTPMSTSDLVALICRAQNNLCPGLSYEDPLAPRRTPRLRSYSRGGPNALQNERLLSTEDFIVQGSMYKRENWRKAP